MCTNNCVRQCKLTIVSGIVNCVWQCFVWPVVEEVMSILRIGSNERTDWLTRVGIELLGQQKNLEGLFACNNLSSLKALLTHHSIYRLCHPRHPNLSALSKSVTFPPPSLPSYSSQIVTAKVFFCQQMDGKEKMATLGMDDMLGTDDDDKIKCRTILGW